LAQSLKRGRFSGLPLRVYKTFFRRFLLYFFLTMWFLTPFFDFLKYIRFLYGLQLFLFLGLGIIVSREMGVFWAVSCGVLVGAVPFFARFKWVTYLEKGWFLAGVFFFIGGAFWVFIKEEQYRQNPFTPIENQKKSWMGRVIDFPVFKNGTLRATVKLEGGAAGKVLVFFSGCGSNRLAYGDRIRFQGKIRIPPGQRNPGGFDYRRFLFRKGIEGTLFSKGGDLIFLERGRGNPITHGIIIPVRGFILRKIDFHLSRPTGALLKSVLLGEKNHLDSVLLDAFSRTGLMHVLAVSGLHAGLIGTFCFFLLSLFRLPRQVCFLGVIPFLWCYAALTGWSPSVVRASLMGTVFLVSRVFQKPANIYNTLALAGLILLIFNPLYLFDLGFLLSFSATFFILFLYSPLLKALPESLRKNPVSRVLLGLLLVSLTATLGTFPFIVSSFNQVAVLGLFANLLVVPVIGLFVSTGLLFLGLAVFSDTVAGFVGGALEVCGEFLSQFVSGVSKIKGAYAEIATPPEWVWIFFIGTLLLAPFLGRKKWAFKGLVWLVTIFCVTLSGTLLFGHLNPTLTFTFLDVGQGDACLIEFSDGKTLLVDGGMRNFRQDRGKRIILPFLRRKGIRFLDGVMLSHPDADHLGGLLTIIGNVGVGQIFSPGFPGKSKLLAQFRGIADSLHIPIIHLKSGDSLKGWGKSSIRVLNPVFCSLEEKGPNNASIVFTLTVKGKRGNFSALFTGDIEKEVEKDLVDVSALSAVDFIKVPHHGSKTSSTWEFIQAASPKFGIVSVARFSPFRHPNKEVLDRYKKAETKLFFTDDHGALVVKVRKGRAKYFPLHPG